MKITVYYSKRKPKSIYSLPFVEWVSYSKKKLQREVDSMEMSWNCFFVHPWEGTLLSIFEYSEDTSEVNDYTYGKYFEMLRYTFYRVSDSVSKDSVSKDSVSKDSVSKDSVSKDSVSKDSVSSQYFIDWEKPNLLQLYLVHLMSYGEMNCSPRISSLDKINHIDFIAWIHLDSCIEREKLMREQLRFQPHICFPAFDTSLQIDHFFVRDKDVDVFPSHTLAEYATLLSHLNCIKLCSHIPDAHHSYVLICEDDISLDFYETWGKDFKQIIEGAPPDWEIISFGYYNTSLCPKPKEYTPWSGEWGACAYLIHKERCRKRIPQLQHQHRWVVHLYDSMVADYYVFYYFKTYVYQYSYFTIPDTNNSTIHPDHIPYHMLYKKYNIIHLKKMKEKLFP